MEKQAILDRIKELRRRKNLSQADMADKLFISLKSYQNIEYGITKIDIDRLERIIELLGGTLEDVLSYNSAQNHVTCGQNLYEKLLEERNRYIEKLESDVLYYQKLLENK